MHMKSTTRARSPFVALVVLALLFTGISAIAYPTLSSDTEGDTDPNLRDGKALTYDEDGNEMITIRGIGGFVFTADGKPVQGIQVVMKKIEQPPLPPERPDPVTDSDDDGTDRPVKDGNRGDDKNWDGDWKKDDPAGTDRPNTNTNTDRVPTNDPEVPERERDFLETKTDRTGYFEFLGLERANYHLAIIKENRVVYEQKMTYSGAGSTAMRIILREKAERETFVIKGIVVNEKGKPVPGAYVELIRNQPKIQRPRDRPVNDRDPNVRPGNGEYPNDRPDNPDQPKDDENPYDRPNDYPGNENGQVRTDGTKQYNERPQDNSGEWDEKDQPERKKMPPIKSGRTTKTDREGHFGFRGVERGSYTLIVKAKGHDPAKQQLKVVEDTRTKVLLKHLRPVQKHFKILATPVDGDGDGHPDDVMITAFGPEGKPLGGVRIFIDGDHVGDTRSQGWLLALNYEPGVHEAIGVLWDQKAHARFIIPGERPQEPPYPPYPEYGHLKGEVFSDDGAIVGAVIEIENDDFHAERRSLYEGEFVFERLPVGEYVIHVFADGFHEFHHEVWVGEDGNHYMEIHLEPHDEEPPIEHGSIKGMIVNEEGEILADAQGYVHAHHEVLDITLGARYLQRGHFQYEKVPAGIIIIRITIGNHPQQTMEVEVHPNEVTKVTVVLKPHEEEPPEESGTIKGTLVNENDEILKDAKGYVRAYHDHLDIALGVAYINEGIFVFERVPAGVIHLVIFVHDHPEQEMTVEVKPGDVTEVTVTVETPEEEPPLEFGALLGTVINSDGEGVDGAEVMIRNQYHHFPSETREGKFEYEIYPGEYVLTIFADGYVPYEGIVVIESKEILEIEIVLETKNIPDSGAIRGTLMNENDEILKDVRGYVLATHEDPEISIRTTYLNGGIFSFEDVPAGVITLEIRPHGYEILTMTVEVHPGETAEITVLLEEDGE